MVRPGNSFLFPSLSKAHMRLPHVKTILFKFILLYLSMTKAELKIEIQRVINNVPENILEDVLDFLKELQEQPDSKVKLTNNLRKILSEDKELLERLAK